MTTTALRHAPANVTARPNSSNTRLWIAQGLLAVLFLFAGGMKLVIPAAALAAAGLVIIMIGATVVTVVNGPAAGAVVPAIVGVLATYVAGGRRDA